MATQRSGHKFDFSYIATFILTATFAGFTLGTLTLLGPVRLLVAEMRKRHVDPSTESFTVVLCMVILLAFTLIISAALSTFLVAPGRRWPRVITAVTVVVLAIAANFVWTHPSLMRSTMAAEQTAAMFTFGPYPSDEKFLELKQRGYVGVISLLHPAVVPFEPQLYAAEARVAKRVGIELIHAPMLPWVSDNRRSLDLIERLADAKKGRYYVHCYLGMDRVMMVKRLIDAKGVTAVVVTARARQSIDKMVYERGTGVMLDENTFVTPYPTPREYVKVLSGDIDRVVVLYDSGKREPSARLAEEKTMLAANSLPITVIPLSTTPFDGAALLQAVQQVRAMEGRKVVHEFYGPGSGRAPLAEGFIAAFRSGRAPILPLLTSQPPLLHGPVSLLAVDVATGPRPVEREFGGRLVESGVKKFICIGKKNPDCAADRLLGNRYGFTIVEAADERAIRAALATGGPHYLYSPKGSVPGPLLSALRIQ